MFFYLELKIHGLLISHVYYWFEINKLNPLLGSTWEVDETSLAREFTIISAKENELGKSLKYKWGRPKMVHYHPISKVMIREEPINWRL